LAHNHIHLPPLTNFYSPQNHNNTVTERDTQRRERMERKVMVVCCVVAFLGLLSAATSFAAEATRIKVSVFFFFNVFLYLSFPENRQSKVSIFILIFVVYSSLNISTSSCGCYIVKGTLKFSIFSLFFFRHLLCMFFLFAFKLRNYIDPLLFIVVVFTVYL
jgi:hypothetical protein